MNHFIWLPSELKHVTMVFLQPVCSSRVMAFFSGWIRLEARSLRAPTRLMNYLVKHYTLTPSLTHPM